MRGPLALRAEVASGTDQPFAEMPIPNAIDDDARGQGGGITKNFVAQFSAAGTLEKLALFIGFSQHCRKVAWNNVTRIRHVARFEKRQVARLTGPVVHLSHERIFAVDI